MPDEALLDRCRGVLLGLAAGDLNGGPVRLAVRLAESLRQRGSFDAQDALSRYLAWWREGAFDTGPVCSRVLALVDSGLPAGEAVARAHLQLGGMTAGCNPAHRSPPLAMLAAIADEDLPQQAAAEAALTHLDPLAGDIAAVVCILCRSLIRGAGWEAALSRAAEGRMERTRQAMLAAATRPGGKGGLAPEALQAALFFVGGAGGLADALGRSFAFAGPANYCPVLAGAIGGARWGGSQVEEAALGHREVRDRVAAVADALALGWA